MLTDIDSHPCVRAHAPLSLDCVRLQEFGNAGMSRPFLVVYTGGIFVNALSPLVLHLILARQHHPTSIARWIRKAVLFDAFCDTIYGT